MTSTPAKSKYDEWLEGFSFHKTPKGVRLTLTCYVYPDTHGAFHHPDGGDGHGYPVYDAAEAARVFADLWRRASMVRAK